MTVQDDERERELVRMFNLSWDPAHQRAGVDAELITTVNGQRFRFDVEVKSTTGATVSTARDVGMDHIRRWRQMIFVVGFYSREARRPELRTCLCLTPIDMEPWIAMIEAKIAIDFKLAERSSHRLTLDDLFDVCGERSTYSLRDAKTLHRSQWSAAQYERALDAAEAGERRISRAGMLAILRLRARYIAERGATLNNPHITKSHLQAFFGTDREVGHHSSAERIRALVSDFVRENPSHRAAQRI